MFKKFIKIDIVGVFAFASNLMAGVASGNVIQGLKVVAKMIQIGNDKVTNYQYTLRSCTDANDLAYIIVKDRWTATTLLVGQLDEALKNGWVPNSLMPQLNRKIAHKILYKKIPKCTLMR